MSWSTVLAILNSPLGAAAVLSLGIAAVKYVPGFLKKGQDAADAKLDKSAFFKTHPGFRSGLDYVMTMARLIVTGVGQTVVETAKSEGRFDATVANAAKQQALNMLKVSLSAPGRDQFLTEVGLTPDQAHKADDILSHIVEAAVADYKAKKSPAQTSVDALAAALKALIAPTPAPALAMANPALPTPAAAAPATSAAPL